MFFCSKRARQENALCLPLGRFTDFLLLHFSFLVTNLCTLIDNYHQHQQKQAKAKTGRQNFSRRKPGFKASEPAYIYSSPLLFLSPARSFKEVDTLFFPSLPPLLLLRVPSAAVIYLRNIVSKAAHNKETLINYGDMSRQQPGTGAKTQGERSLIISSSSKQHMSSICFQSMMMQQKHHHQQHPH